MVWYGLALECLIPVAVLVPNVGVPQRVQVRYRCPRAEKRVEDLELGLGFTQRACDGSEHWVDVFVGLQRCLAVVSGICSKRMFWQTAGATVQPWIGDSVVGRLGWCTGG